MNETRVFSISEFELKGAVLEEEKTSGPYTYDAIIFHKAEGTHQTSSSRGQGELLITGP